jgi:hypothetical protein
LPEPAVNVAPAVMAVPEAVSDAMASPSGSPAPTVNVSNAFSQAALMAGAVTTGARSWLAMLMLVVAEPDKNEEVAVNVTERVPDCEKVGVQLNVPLVFPGPAANVPPAVMAVPAAVREVMASPSGLPAVTLTVKSIPSVPEAVAGAVTTGGRSHWATTIEVAAEPLRAFWAVKNAL